MDLAELFEQALSIEEPWFIREIRFDGERKRLDIYIDFKKGARFYYKGEGSDGHFKAYDTREKEWRHLNFFEHECYLHCRTPRIKTSDNKVRLVLPPWAGLNTGFTLLFEAFLLELCSEMPVAVVGRLVNETDGKLWRLLEKYVDRARALADYSGVEVVGMDETSRAKGHDYISLFVDLERKRTVYIADGKGSETVKDFAKDLEEHRGSAKMVTEVSCDMSPAFIKGVKENLPNAEITFDKFHIMKIINHAVDQVRKAEVKLFPILIGSKYLLLKNEENLTKKQFERLKAIKLWKINLKSIRALHIRENFQAIYKARTEQEFELLLKKWYWWATHSRIEPIRQVAHTIKRHWYGVIHWFRSKINNGILEGLNSVVQAAKAKARGFSNVHYFKIIAYLVTANLDFNNINPYYVSD